MARELNLQGGAGGSRRGQGRSPNSKPDGNHRAHRCDMAPTTGAVCTPLFRPSAHGASPASAAYTETPLMATRDDSERLWNFFSFLLVISWSVDCKSNAAPNYPFHSPARPVQGFAIGATACSTDTAAASSCLTVTSSAHSAIPTATFPSVVGSGRIAREKLEI